MVLILEKLFLIFMDKMHENSIDQCIGEDKEKKASIADTIKTSRLMEPTFILVIATSAFYIFVYYYYKGFCDRLSIPYRGLDLPFAFFLLAGSKIAMIIFGIASILFLLLVLRKTKVFGVLDWHYREIIYVVLIASIGLILWAFILDYISVLSSAKIPDIILLIPFIIFSTLIYSAIFSSVYKIYKKLNNLIIPIVKTRSNYLIVKYSTMYVILFILFIVIIYFLIYYPYSLGDSEAKELIEGDIGNLNITFDSKIKNETSFIYNKTFILVMYPTSRR